MLGFLPGTSRHRPGRACQRATHTDVCAPTRNRSNLAKNRRRTRKHSGNHTITAWRHLPSPSASSRTMQPTDTAANLGRAEQMVRTRRKKARKSSVSRSCSTRRTSARRSSATASTSRSRSRVRPPTGCRRLLASWQVVIIVPIFERQTAGIYRNSAAIIDADGIAARRLSQDAHPRRSALLREVLLHAGRRPLRLSRRTPGEANGFKVWKTRYATIGVLICWDQWYPGGRAHHDAARRAGALLSDRHRLASGGEGRMGRRAGRCVAHDPARRTRSPTASTSRRPIASATKTEPGTNGITFFGHSFIADPFGRYVAEAGRAGRDRDRAVRPGAHRGRCARNWPFLRDRRVDAYGPILSRYLA